MTSNFAEIGEARAKAKPDISQPPQTDDIGEARAGSETNGSAPPQTELTEAAWRVQPRARAPQSTRLQQAIAFAKPMRRQPAASPLPEAEENPSPSPDAPRASELTEAMMPVPTSLLAPPLTHLPEARKTPTSIAPAPRASTKRVRPQPQASYEAPTGCGPPAAEIPEARSCAIPIRAAPPETHSGGHEAGGNHHFPAARNPTELAGPSGCDTQTGGASQPPSAELAGQVLVETQTQSASQPQPDDGQISFEDQSRGAIVGNLAMHTRRYEDLRRAHQRLLLQAKAACRYACDGDKKAGEELYAKALKGGAMLPWLLPYLKAMEPLETAIAEQAKVIAKLARQLPVWEWAKGIAGLSDRFLGIIVGECSAGPGEYKSVSALWKRMGLAVIDGERQRRVVGDAAIMHGYVARRRAIMWNIGESIIKQQVRKDPDDENARIGTGYYGQVYLERKAYEATRTDKPIIAHARAKRYMEKRLLRELWKAWRKA